MDKKTEEYEDIETDDGNELPDYEDDYDYDDEDMDCSWLDTDEETEGEV